MAIKMVREPSETPNINNIDDIVPMRYAYGGQNGYVIGKGTEISNTVNGLNFTVNSGRLVLQGVECDIDATGVTITIDNIATKRYYTIYLEVNLGLNTATIKDEYDTADYPTIDLGDDLTQNSSGIARMILYKFTATNGIIAETNKVVESIKYTKDIEVNNSNNSYKVNNLEIKEDGNNKLTLNEYIIPKRLLLYDDTIRPRPIVPAGSGTIDIDLTNITKGKNHVEFQMLAGTHVFYQKMQIGSGDAQSFCWDNYTWDAYYDNTNNKFIINRVAGNGLTFVRCWEIIE